MKLHDYQRLGVKFLQNNPRAGLFLDMGLGKTACVLSALKPEHLPCLVVAPKRVAEETWPVEHELWRPDLDIALAIGGAEQRKAALQSTADLYVISQDNLKDLPNFRHKFNTMVIDESSGYKNYTSTRFKIANAMSLRTEATWLLTGTPSPNGYMDLWSQIYLLDQGKRLGEKITHFRDRWFYPIRTNANHVVMEWGSIPGAKDEIKGLIQDICLYMESDGRVELPELAFNPVHFNLDPKIMKFYRKLKQDMVADMKELGLSVSADNAGILSNRLSQVAAGFVYEWDHDTSTRNTLHIHDQRIDVVRELLEYVTSPTVIAYRYQEEERRLLELPGARSIRSKNVLADWNKGNVPILVAHPASAGHGLNLQHGGHTMIYSSPQWSLELYLQMNKRLHRQGQQHPVIIHQVIAKGTTDPLIYARLGDKNATQQDLLEHLRSPV